MRRFLPIATLLACACSSTSDYRVTLEHALSGFRETSPLVHELTDRAAAVAVFIGVEDLGSGCAHAGLLVLADGEKQDVLLRCLEDPPAPGGYAYHQLVALRDADQVELLAESPLLLDDFARLDPLDESDLEEHADAPGWIVSTHRPQLLFGDQTVRQRLELPDGRPRPPAHPVSRR